MLDKFLWGFFLLLIGCTTPKRENIAPQKTENKIEVYTRPSHEVNRYLNFNSVNAINRIAAIENEYFNQYETGFSKFYGTEWMASAPFEYSICDTLSNWEIYLNYLKEQDIKPDSMHCTIYAVEGLKAGMDSLFNSLEEKHRQIWKKREHAGWSIGYILTEFYNWKAYLIISKSSDEYELCLKNYAKDGKYHVWKQPNISIENVYDFDEQKVNIDSLLLKHEFGWGFSDQGWHTWITRYDTLKECNWAGAPANQFNINNESPLFLKTKFTEYFDYSSHIIIFPSKK